MKNNKNVFLLFSFLIAAFSMQAQHYKCGTVHTEEFMERLEANVKYSNNHLSRMYETRYVPIAFHLVADSDGNGRIPEETVYKQLCLINQQYDSLGFVFYRKEFNYLDNSLVFDHEGNYTSAIIQAKVPGAVNVFLVNNVFEGAGGYYSPFGDFVAIPKLYFNREDNVPFSHEIGHYFSIAHPHVGWEDAPYTPALYGETVTIGSIGSQQTGGQVTVELQNGSNCSVAADRICDTPPDYGFMQSANACSNPWEGIVKDRNGDLIYSIPDLYMTYNGYGCSIYNWTHGQATAMMADYDNRGNIEKTNVPDTLLVTQVPALVYPGNFEKVEEYNNILIDWEPVANAQGYILKVAGASELVINTTDTEYLATNLLPDASYSYVVYPIHEIGYCLDVEESFLFFTGTTTSTNDIVGVNAINLYPNPVTQASEVTLALDLDNDMDLDISVLSADGKLVIASQSIRATSGSFIHKLNVTDLNQGIYFVNIKSATGSILKRILISQ